MLHLSVLAEAEDKRFFELAATIIPIILFGSVLARAFRPPGLDVKVKAWHGWAAIFLAIYIIVMATAEILAIAFAVEGGASDPGKVIVAIALVVEVFGFGLAILVPWVVRFHRAGKTHWVMGTLLGIVFLVFFGWASVYFMEFAFEGSQGDALEKELSQADEAAQLTQLAWYRAAIAAHADHHLSHLERHELSLLWHRKVIARQQDLGILEPSP